MSLVFSHSQDTRILTKLVTPSSLLEDLPGETSIFVAKQRYQFILRFKYSLTKNCNFLPCV